MSSLNASLFSSMDDIQCSAINYSILSEHVSTWTSSFFVTWYIFSSIFSISFNLGVFALFYQHKHLRSPGNLLFLCLALADLLIGGLVIPWKITCYLIYPPPIGIRLMVVLVDYLLSAAFLCICGLTYDRYQAIINPLTYSSKVDSKTIKIACVLIWTLPMVHLVRFAWFLSPGITASSSDSKFSTFLVSCMITVTLTVLFAYRRIFREASNRQTQITDIQITRQTGKTRKTGKTRLTKAFRSCLAVTLCFTGCWIPRSVFMGRIFLRYPRSLEWDLITFGLMVLSSSLNPILYSIYSHDIRTVIVGSRLCAVLMRMKRSKTTPWENPAIIFQN